MPRPRRESIHWFNCELLSRVEVQYLSHSDQIGQRAGTDLPHCVPPVHLDRNLGYVQLARNLLVHQPGADTGHDITLAARQGVKARLDVFDRFLTFAAFPVLFETALYGIKQILIAKWFRQELERASLHGADSHGNVSISRNE